MNRKAFQMYLKAEGTARRESTLGNASNIFGDNFDGRVYLYNYVMKTREVGNIVIDSADLPEVYRIVMFEDHPSEANVFITGGFIIEWTVYGEERKD